SVAGAADERRREPVRSVARIGIDPPRRPRRGDRPAAAALGARQGGRRSGRAGFGRTRSWQVAPHRRARGRLHPEPYLRLRYFCSPYCRDSALYPFIDQLWHAAELARDDPPAAKLEKLEILLASAAPRDEDVALLADLLSFAVSERHSLPNLSPQRQKEPALEAPIRPLAGL